MRFAVHMAGPAPRDANAKIEVPRSFDFHLLDHRSDPSTCRFNPLDWQQIPYMSFLTCRVLYPTCLPCACSFHYALRKTRSDQGSVATFPLLVSAYAVFLLPSLPLAFPHSLISVFPPFPIRFRTACSRNLRECDTCSYSDYPLNITATRAAGDHHDGDLDEITDAEHPSNAHGFHVHVGTPPAGTLLTT